MILDRARTVADAVLFEGYLLYPYRASALKNKMRWQFGVLTPCAATSSEPSYAHTECLVESEGDPTLELQVRFLHLRRRIGADTWDEGIVRDVALSVRLDQLSDEQEIPFDISGKEEAGGEVTCQPLSGIIRLDVQHLDESHGLRRVRVTVENHTPWELGSDATREEILRRSLVSTHTLLGVDGGDFVSLLEPPDWAAPAADACRNVHTWPVLIGERGQRDVVLSAPIILYDYPAVAPQSPGDLFDATEIDEILTLRTMALTDQEKQEARATDPRAAAIIDRTESLSREELERMHGTLRYSAGEEQ